MRKAKNIIIITAVYCDTKGYMYYVGANALTYKDNQFDKMIFVKESR